MSFKDFFVKSDGLAHISPKSSVAAMNTAINTMPEGSYTPASTQVDAGSVNEFNQYLMKLMDDANLPGPDYYEFAKALSGMNTLPITEQQKYVSVFAGFQAQGVTAQSLVDAAMKYIAILGQKKSSEFDASVASASNSISNIEAEIANLTKENEGLAAKLTANGQKIADFNTKVIENKQKLEVKKTTFEVSYKNFINKIMQDTDNIKKYLINGNTTQ